MFLCLDEGRREREEVNRRKRYVYAPQCGISTNKTRRSYTLARNVMRGRAWLPYQHLHLLLLFFSSS